MRRCAFRLAISAGLSAGIMLAQDITGTWQGTLELPNKTELRTVVKIAKDDSGLKAAFYSIDQTPQPIAAAVTLAQSTVTLTIPAIAGKYEGKLDSDAVTLTGTWTQASNAPIPLELK